MELSLGLAFLAGVIFFVSPCVLALVPVYLAYLGETAGSIGEPVGPPRTGLIGVATQPVVGQVAFFTLSFGAIFVLLGTSAGLIGASLFRVVPFAREAAGLAVIALGLLMTGIFGPVLSRFSWQPPMARLPAARSARSVSLGALFALGWNPCIGPVLGAILAIGATSQQAGIAALLLAKGVAHHRRGAGQDRGGNQADRGQQSPGLAAKAHDRRLDPLRGSRESTPRRWWLVELRRAEAA